MKYGRRPAQHTLKSMRRALTLGGHLNTLGAAPIVSDDYVSAVTVPWGILGNDLVGDCTCADAAHTLMLRTANASSIVVPTEQDVLALYSAISGYNPSDPSTDIGCSESAVVTYLEIVGFLGHKLDATGMIDPANVDHVKWTVQLFGSCRIGLNMPAYAADQFNAGVPWDIDPQADQTIEGGHDVPIVKYDAGLFYVVTWGQLQAMTPAFFAKYCDEAHAEIFLDWIRAVGTAPSGFAIDQLVADLTSLRA